MAVVAAVRVCRREDLGVGVQEVTEKTDTLRACRGQILERFTRQLLEHLALTLSLLDSSSSEFSIHNSLSCLRQLLLIASRLPGTSVGGVIRGLSALGTWWTGWWCLLTLLDLLLPLCLEELLLLLFLLAFQLFLLLLGLKLELALFLFKGVNTEQ